MTSAEINPIGYLLELCQKHGFAFPQYLDIDFTGPDHCREFTVKCTFQDLEVLGKARQKKLAKSKAAEKMIACLKENKFFDPLLSGNGPTCGKSIEASLGKTSKKNSSPTKNPISLLNEYSQKLGIPQPQFMIGSIEQNFFCKCEIEGKTTYGNATNKKSAKTESAFKMCRVLKIIDDLPGESEDSVDEMESISVQPDIAAQRALDSFNAQQDENCNERARVLPEFKIIESSDEEETVKESKLDFELIPKLESLKVAEAEPENKDAPDCPLEETSQGDSRTHKAKTSVLLEKWVGNDKNL